jgi:sensor domain CHASE-containing protein
VEKRPWLLAALGLALLGAAAWTATRMRSDLLARLDQADHEEARQRGERAVAALGEELTELGHVTEDYAYWDGMYAYMQHRQDSFVATELPSATTGTLRLHVMAIVDGDGAVVFGRVLDQERKTDGPLDGTLGARLSAVARTRVRPGHAGVEGLVLDGPRVVLMAARPILNSRGQGPPRGLLVMGRYLDAWQVEKMTRYTRYALGVFRLPAAPPDVRAVQDQLRLGHVLVRSRDDSSIAAYALIEDVEEQPALVLRVDAARHLHLAGRDALDPLRMAFVVVGGGLALALLSMAFAVARPPASR